MPKGKGERAASPAAGFQPRESPIDAFFGVRLDFLITFFVFGQLCLDIVRDLIVLNRASDEDAAVIAEAATYYARNVNSFEFQWLLPLVSVVGTVFVVTRAYFRRGVDDFVRFQ